MKKILFLFICFFCLNSIVLAEKYLYFFDVEEGSSVLNETFTSEDFVSLYNGSGLDDFIVSYYGKDRVLLESYALPYSPVYVSEYNIGLNCDDAYEMAKTGSSFHCSLGQEGIYSSKNDISKIKYWKIVDYYNYYDDEGISSFYDFCLNNNETHNSRLCSDLIFKSVFDFPESWHYIGFIEYDPVDFELVCDENTKKGENVKCDLKINATDEIKELTIPLKDDSYELVNYKEVEGWKLVKNDDNTITLTSDSGFKGVGVVLNSEFKINDQTVDEVNIEMKNINVTTIDENNLNFTINNKVVLSNNTEDKKDELSNPNTSSFNVYIIIGFIMLLGGIVRLLKPKKHFE